MCSRSSPWYYRQLAASPTALALKAKVLPDNLKNLETALRGVGIDPDQDVDSLIFASFRTQDKGLRVIGIAQGQFNKANPIDFTTESASGIKGPFPIFHCNR